MVGCSSEGGRDNLRSTGLTEVKQPAILVSASPVPRNGHGPSATDDLPKNNGGRGCRDFLHDPTDGILTEECHIETVRSVIGAAASNEDFRAAGSGRRSVAAVQATFCLEVWPRGYRRDEPAELKIEGVGLRLAHSDSRGASL
jgi:hypothetical protein